MFESVCSYNLRRNRYAKLEGTSGAGSAIQFAGRNRRELYVGYQVSLAVILDLVSKETKTSKLESQLFSLFTGWVYKLLQNKSDVLGWDYERPQKVSP